MTVRLLVVRRIRGASVQRCMTAPDVVVVTKLQQLVFEIKGIPEQNLVEKLPPNRPNEALNKGMRPWYVRNRFDLLNVEDPKVCLPAVILEQGIIVGAEVARLSLSSDGMVEHPAQSNPIDGAGVNSNANESPRELIHNHENPVRPQNDGLAPKQVHTPQTILRVADHRQPRGTPPPQSGR